MERFWNKVDKNGPNGCWVWTASTGSNGYGQFNFNGSMVRAHRLAWKLLKGRIPKQCSLLHSCDNRLCVNPDHLMLGTQQDNMRDMRQKGRDVKGSLHPNSKLTEEKVREIRAKYADRNTPTGVIGKIYGVTRHTIGYILNNKIWKHVQ